MDSTSILPRGGCRFIAGDPQDFHTQGEAIFCGKPVARAGGSWIARYESPKRSRRFWQTGVTAWSKAAFAQESFVTSWRRAAPTLLIGVIIAAAGGCVGPPVLERQVLGYDQVTKTLDEQLLLLNIARVAHDDREVGSRAANATRW